MNVLIAYTTIEGQMGKIATFLEEHLRQSGCDVTLVDMGDRMAEVSLDGVDKVILAAPVHERRHPKNFEVFLGAQGKELAEKDSLFLSVSLSAAFAEGMDEAQEYVEEMQLRTGFTPTQVACVAGAVRLGEYDFYAMQVVQHVVMRGKAFDAAAGEHAFTDWDALKQTVAEFVGLTPEPANP